MKTNFRKNLSLWVTGTSPIKMSIINGLFFSSIPRVCTYSRINRTPRNGVTSFWKATCYIKSVKGSLLLKLNLTYIDTEKCCPNFFRVITYQLMVYRFLIVDCFVISKVYFLNIISMQSLLQCCNT